MAVRFQWPRGQATYRKGNLGRGPFRTVVSRRHPDACHEAGPLDEKTRRLVKLGIAIGHQSEGATKSHARRALEGGATAEEVRHTVLLALTTAGFPAMTAAALWVEQVLSNRSDSSSD